MSVRPVLRLVVYGALRSETQFQLQSFFNDETIGLMEALATQLEFEVSGWGLEEGFKKSIEPVRMVQ